MSDPRYHNEQFSLPAQPPFHAAVIRGPQIGGPVRFGLPSQPGMVSPAHVWYGQLDQYRPPQQNAVPPPQYTPVQPSVAQQQVLPPAPPVQEQHMQHKRPLSAQAEAFMPSLDNLLLEAGTESANGVEVDIQESSSQRRLVPGYIKQLPGYFQVGTVFEMDWVEPAGEIENGSVTTYRIRGTEYFSKNRKFVVIEKKHGHCMAMPISTYRGDGVAKNGLKKSEHVIIHSEKEAPLPEESEKPTKQGEKPMKPHPIRVITSDRGARLQRMSRLNLGLLCTIQDYYKYEQANQERKNAEKRRKKIANQEKKRVDSLSQMSEEWNGG